MFFRSEKRDEPLEEPKLGFRSTLVLAKIGYDLREQYSGLLEEPLPPEIEQGVERLLGPGADVKQLEDRRPKLQG